jgi:hypothetical protein
MGAPLGPAARSWRAATALLGAVLLLALAVIIVPRIRVPVAAADHRTWALFGRPATPGGWVAGDGSYPVTLPDGRVAWLFGDSRVRRADGNDAWVRNSIVEQDRHGRLRTLTGGSAAAPSDLIPPVQPGTWLWPSGGFVEGGRLMVFAEEFARPPGSGAGGSGGFQFQATGRRYLVPFQLPALTGGAPREVYGGPVAWGHAVLVSGGQVYVYGNLERDGWTNLTYLARFPLGQSSGYWQFWDGSGFGPDPLAAAPLQGPNGAPLVAKLSSVVPNPGPAAPAGGGFAAFTINPFGTAIDLRAAAAPQGPWSASHALYTIPEQHPYLPRAHVAGTGTIQLAYSVPDSRPRYLTARW